MSYTYDTRRPRRRRPSHRGYHTARARTNGKTGRSGAEEEEDSPLGGAQSSGSPTGGKEPQESEAPRAPTGGGEARRPPPVNWPVEREGSGAKIGKENVLVEERPVPKEGIRIRKDVMEDRSPHLVYLVTLDTRSARMPLHIGRFCGLGPTPFCGERRSRAFSRKREGASDHSDGRRRTGTSAFGDVYPRVSLEGGSGVRRAGPGHLPRARGLLYNPAESSEAPHTQEGGQVHKTGEGEMRLPSL